MNEGKPPQHFKTRRSTRRARWRDCRTSSRVYRSAIPCRPVNRKGLRLGTRSRATYTCTCVDIKMLRRVRSMAWRCRFLTTRAPDAPVDFHTDSYSVRLNASRCFHPKSSLSSKEFAVEEQAKSLLSRCNRARFSWSRAFSTFRCFVARSEHRACSSVVVVALEAHKARSTSTAFSASSAARKAFTDASQNLTRPGGDGTGMSMSSDASATLIHDCNPRSKTWEDMHLVS